MDKNQIIYLNGHHQHFNMYIGNKENKDMFKDSETEKIGQDEKVIPLEQYLKK